MKNTTGLYKHQRDNQGKRRRLPNVAKATRLVAVTEYEYEKARKACGSQYGEASQSDGQLDSVKGASPAASGDSE